jgi:hypothetical protein
MNWDAVGAIGEIIGALAVVITVLYLATQVKQGNRQGASDAGFAVVSEMSRWDEFVFSDPEVSKLLVKMKRDEDLSDEERLRAEAIADRLINIWYVAENAYSNGTMSEGLYDDCADDARRHLRSYPALRTHCRNVLSHYRFAQDMKIYAAIFEEA